MSLDCSAGRLKKQGKGRFAVSKPGWNVWVGRRSALSVAAIVVLVTLGVALHFAVEPRQATAWLASQRAFVDHNPFSAMAAYFAFYVAFAALSAPGAWAVSVAGGALFGPWLGAPLVAVSSTVGATAAMLAARYLFRESVVARFPDLAERVGRGVERDGARWLFAARLTPVVPFSAINIAIGLTRMPAALFAAVTCLGVFPLSVMYALAGAQFVTIQRPSDVLNVPVLLTLLALAAAPFLVKSLGRQRSSRSAEPLAGSETATNDPGSSRDRARIRTECPSAAMFRPSCCVDSHSGDPSDDAGA